MRRCHSPPPKSSSPPSSLPCPPLPLICLHLGLHPLSPGLPSPPCLQHHCWEGSTPIPHVTARGVFPNKTLPPSNPPMTCCCPLNKFQTSYHIARFVPASVNPNCGPHAVPAAGNALTKRPSLTSTGPGSLLCVMGGTIICRFLLFLHYYPETESSILYINHFFNVKQIMQYFYKKCKQPETEQRNLFPTHPY